MIDTGKPTNNDPKDVWTDPSGNICRIDLAKWNAKERAEREKAGWHKSTDAEIASAKKRAEEADGGTPSKGATKK